MDYLVIIFGVIILGYGLFEYIIGKAFVPAWPFLPEEGFYNKTNNKEAFWILVLIKIALGSILILGSIYKTIA